MRHPRHRRHRWRSERRYRRRRLVAVLVMTTILGAGDAAVALAFDGQASHSAKNTTPPPLVWSSPTPSSRTRATTTADQQPPPTSTPNAPGIAIASPEPPLGDYDLPGPFITRVGNSYYLYLSTALGDFSRNIDVVPGSPGNWDWAAARDAMPVAPAWAEPNNGTESGGQVWEPDVVKFGTTYVMYSAPTVANYRPKTHCIGVATSSSPLGPFVPSPNPVVCQMALGGDIDAQVFVDPAGPDGPRHPYYLVWKSDSNNLVGSNPARFPTRIWAQGLSNDGLQVIGSPRSIFAADEAWQQGLVEAPQMYRGPGGTLYLFYSGGSCFCTAAYGMGVARCVSVFGPCTDLSATPWITSNAEGIGPGEESLFVGPDGSVWLLYSPWHAGALFEGLFRPVEAIRVGFGPLGPYVAEAGSFPEPYPKLNAEHPVRPND